MKPICQRLVAFTLVLAATACTAQPSPTAEPTNTPIPTTAPTATATAPPTATATLTPTPTASATPTATPAPTQTPTPPQPTNTPDPIPGRTIYSSPGLGLSLAYPGAWQVEDSDSSMTIASPDVATSNRTAGAELIIAAGPPKRPDETLQAEWDAAVNAFPEVSFGEPTATNIGGEEAYRAWFNDPRDNSQGWFIVFRHGGSMYILVTQTFSVADWNMYEGAFAAMLYTVWFA